MAVVGGNVKLVNVYGGYSTNGDACNNVAIVNSGTISGNVAGGYAYNEATATGNQVFIYGGNFTNEAGNKTVSGGQGKFANENMVVVYGGSFANEINGGVVMESGGTAMNNTVVLAGNFSGNPRVYGGNLGDQAYAVEDIVTGNTLEVWAKNLNVKSVGNFQNHYFILPAGVKSGDTMLTVTGGQPTVFVTKANVGVAMASGAKLNKGDKVTLIRNAAGFTGEGYQQVSLAGKTLKGTGGVSLKYGFALSDTPTTIDATVISAGVNEQTKAVVEARAASLGVANVGADLVAGPAMRSAMAATTPVRDQSAGGGAQSFVVAPFFAGAGGTQRLESGSHVDVNGVAAVAGLAGRKDLDAIVLTGGLFFEYGTSRFNTYNGFDAGDVDGKGGANYTGGGLLVRLDLADTPLQGFYGDGAFRFGGMQSDWRTDDLRDAVTGKGASYELYTPCFGTQLGLGYVWQATGALKVDFHGQWLWARVCGDDASVGDDPYVFDDVDSWRLRFGARVDWNVTKRLGLYAGAAWEHEFDGKARSTAYGFDTPAPSIAGDTGVFDLGVSFRPGAVHNLGIELGASAATGVRNGISGVLMAKFEF